MSNKRTIVVAPEQFEEMIANVPQQEFRDLLTVTWETAARPQESLAEAYRRLLPESDEEPFVPAQLG